MTRTLTRTLTYTQGDTDEQVEKGVVLCMPLLQPVDDSNNEHKLKQLKELSIINGTFREEDYCKICGDRGHQAQDCPTRDPKLRGIVKCAICGEPHATRDCPTRGLGGANMAGMPGQAPPANMDQEYLNFMSELGEDVPGMKAPAGGAGGPKPPGAGAPPGVPASLGSLGNIPSDVFAAPPPSGPQVIKASWQQPPAR